MTDQKRLAELIFKNIGVLGFILGISFLIFGALNFNILPRYYLSLSGSAGLDGLFTVAINGLVWLVCCGILMLIGAEFYGSSRKLAKNELNGEGLITLQFCLFAAIVICGTMIYIILVLMNVIAPVQFFPNVLFVDADTLMDLSIIFNALLFLVLLSILYRVSYKLIKYGFKIGGIK